MRIGKIIPRDERGRVRRFTGHGEALKYIFAAGGLFCLLFSWPLLVDLVIYLSGDRASRTEFLSSASTFATLFGFVLGACIPIYTYLFLSGAIMSREERERRGL